VRPSWSDLLFVNGVAVGKKILVLAKLPFSTIFLSSMVGMAIKKAKKGFLRDFGETENENSLIMKAILIRF